MSVRLLTIKISQWARANFAVIVKYRIDPVLTKSSEEQFLWAKSVMFSSGGRPVYDRSLQEAIMDSRSL